MNATEWDYIVIGAGSVGCASPGRPGEDQREVQLALHRRARPVRNDLVEHWGAGKVIGGSSSINGQVWTRGNAADYDEWAKPTPTAATSAASRSSTSGFAAA